MGDSVGDWLGVSVGVSVGDWLGTPVGGNVGLAVGRMVGTSVGFSVVLTWCCCWKLRWHPQDNVLLICRCDLLSHAKHYSIVLV